MEYKLTGVVRRVIDEEYDVTLEADSSDEAADVFYAVLSEYPDSEMFAARLLCTGRTNVADPEIVSITVESEVANDVEDDDYA